MPESQGKEVQGRAFRKREELQELGKLLVLGFLMLLVFLSLDATLFHSWGFQKFLFQSLLLNTPKETLCGRSLISSAISLGTLAAAGLFSWRRQTKEALWEGERLLTSIFASVQEGLIIKDAEFNVIRVNAAVEKWFAHALPLVGRKCYHALWGRREPCEVCPSRQALETGEATHGEVSKAGSGGQEAGWLELYAFPLMDSATGGRSGVIEFIRDITSRRRLEEQLRQAQKMEVVGRLAGGVAHDFNNLLTAILGYCELLLGSLKEPAPLRQDVLEIKKAGERAALLTRQLLAFSRRQVLRPKLLDLNLVVENLGKMLKRVIGEDIELTLLPGSDLGKVMADPGQVEQVILNLAVNARDAMPQGGRLSIKTGNVDLDGNYARIHAEVEPGPYVLLAVSDTGCGMDAETRANIFAPFFTTKELGKGTGLGLSMVYGVVKQSGGHIWVYSEPGLGTTFKIYFPRLRGTKKTAAEARVAETSPSGQETIMLVEDEEVVRQVAHRILQSQGYTVLDAKDGQEALEISEQYQGPVHLMLTDLVMPGMNGRELALKMKARRAGIKVLYMSGYAEEGIVNQGLLEQRLIYIQKPFEARTLARRVRQLLEAPASPQ